jgi:pyruvate formate lyase activating enzyme
MNDVPGTPPATLTRAREIGLRAGLHYVYTGNVHDTQGGTTQCPSCQAPLVVRDWYRIDDYRLREDGRCPDCGTRIAGRFGEFALARQFGSRRVPVAIRA